MAYLWSHFITYCFVLQDAPQNLYTKRAFGKTLCEVKKLKPFITKSQALKQGKNIFLVVCGTIILSFGSAVFLIPFDLVAGGVTGSAIIIENFSPYSFITVDLIIVVLSWGLFFIGLIFLGKAFAFKTLISTVIYPPSVAFFSRLVEAHFFEKLLNLKGGLYGEVSPLLAALFGGVLVGVGCALTFRGGGSTGGTDILAFVLCRAFKNLRSSVAIFIVDAAVILGGLFVLQSLTLTLLGIITAFVSVIVIDKVFLGQEQAFAAQIISQKEKQLRAEIIEKLSRTTTEISVVGGFTGEAQTMLMVTFTLGQYADLLSIIKSVDAAAFVTIYRAHEISGKGWTR